MDCFLPLFIISFWSTSSNHTTSNDAFHGIINQASNPMAILCGEPTSDHKTWTSSLVNSLESSMHCIHCHINFYPFYKSIYDFGPKHCKQSFIDILIQPVPGIELEEQHDESDSHWHCRCNHKRVSRRLLWNKTLSSKVVTQSMTTIVHVCPITLILWLRILMVTRHMPLWMIPDST